MRKDEFPLLDCSIARTASIIGDSWTLLILRDCFLRVRRFDAFQRRLGVTRHVLAHRLRLLVDRGVLEKVLYQNRPKRYEYRLTARGRDLYPVIMSLIQWGDRHLSDERGAPVRYRHQACGQLFSPVMVCSDCGEPIDPRAVTPEPSPDFAYNLRLFSESD